MKQQQQSQSREAEYRQNAIAAHAAGRNLDASRWSRLGDYERDRAQRSTPVHLRPTSCYVCGVAEPHPPTELHAFVTNAEVDAELAAQPAVAHRYPDGTTDPAAHYVAEYRPY